MHVCMYAVTVHGTYVGAGMVYLKQPCEIWSGSLPPPAPGGIGSGLSTLGSRFYRVLLRIVEPLFISVSALVAAICCRLRMF